MTPGHISVSRLVPVSDLARVIAAMLDGSAPAAGADPATVHAVSPSALAAVCVSATIPAPPRRGTGPAEGVRS